MSRRRTLMLLPVVALLCAASCEIPGVHVLAVAPAQDPRVHERFETVGFVWPDRENPFDPDQIRVAGEFEAPDGRRIEMPGFVYRPFSRSLVGGIERLEATQRPYWMVRFTPDSPGVWRWRWTAVLPEGAAASPWQEVSVAPTSPDRHGWLRVAPEDPRYLRFDDGTPYFAVGENLAWYDARGTFAYDDWLEKLAAQGVNFIRLWMPSWAFGLEWIERDAGGAVRSSSLGNYRDRLDRAWQLDHVLDAAASRGIQVVLCLQNHGAFSLTHNSEWSDNPYHAANGGPLATPSGFFSDPTARALFRRRLRYIVARHGHATNLLSFELWNEVDLAEQPAASAVADWHSEMASEIRSLDPHDHLISTSTAYAIPQPLWMIPELDFTNLHFYAWNDLFAYPLAPDFSTTPGVLLARRPPGKPALMAEIGVHSSGPAETLAADPEAIGFHDALFGGLFGEAFGTGMAWWWDNVVDPQDHYFHFGPVADLTRGVRFHSEGFETGGVTAAAAGFDLRAQALRGRTTVLVWIKNAAHQWWPAASAHPETVAGARLEIEGVDAGDWSVRWIDAYGAGEIGAATPVHGNGRITLAIPPFSRDIALRLERVEADPTAH